LSSVLGFAQKPKQCPLFIFFVFSFFRVFVIVLFPIHHENTKVRKREGLFSRNFATTMRSPSNLIRQAESSAPGPNGAKVNSQG